MTYPGPADQTTVPGRPARPGTVLSAAICFWLAVLMLLVQVPQVIVDLALVAGVTREAGARTGAGAAQVRDEIHGARVFDVLILLVLVALAGLLAVSALRFTGGRDSARVLGLVSAGLVLLCCSTALVGTIVGHGRQPDATEFQRQVTLLQENRTPAWVSTLTFAALAVYPLLLAAAGLLLAPASNRYFRPFAGYYVYPLPPSG
ncbi:MAG TPA: hypothetical protein VJT31_04545 [Rugosimonospora sp.]|nr:hypothetical protein [Rugosimonospora sp.]